MQELLIGLQADGMNNFGIYRILQDAYFIVESRSVENCARDKFVLDVANVVGKLSPLFWVI